MARNGIMNRKWKTHQVKKSGPFRLAEYSASSDVLFRSVFGISDLWGKDQCVFIIIIIIIIIIIVIIIFAMMIFGFFSTICNLVNPWKL